MERDDFAYILIKKKAFWGLFCKNKGKIGLDGVPPLPLLDFLAYWTHPEWQV